jgi:hypothetical protein
MEFYLVRVMGTASLWWTRPAAELAFGLVRDVVARIDIVELHTGPSGETIKIRAVIPSILDCRTVWAVCEEQ